MDCKKINDIEILQFALFSKTNVFDFSTTIEGGISRGNYTSLNLSYYAGDNPSQVDENRIRLASALKVRTDDVFVPYQTHRDKVLVIDERFISLSKNEQLNELKEVDALITDQKGICIGVTTADCVPLLIFDPSKNILAAVHAGWKGTVARIAAKTVRKMMRQFDCKPDELLVGIAPSISPEVFEVGDEVGKAFEDARFDLSRISFRNAETGKLHINLWEANKNQLLDLGVSPHNIEIPGLCTYSNPDKFFSARRQTIHSGRMLTGGVIRRNL